MFGVSTFCLHREPLSEALEELTKITRLVEIMDDGPHYIRDADLLGNYSLSYTLHAPSRGVNIASLLEPIRRASVDVTIESFRIAAEVSGSIVVHPGYFAWEQERPQAEKQFLKSLEELTGAAEDYSVGFSIENMGNWDYFFLRTPDELNLIGDAGFALDVGHANLNHCLPEFLGTHFDHVHLHDNNGDKDTHSPVGDGDIDFRTVMSAVRRDNATTIIEVDTFDGVVSSMEKLRAV
ncbi:MAG TPA: sugar phosphate isomerase/epimerase family protein [Methanoregulaceae archaeon]|nr:sugar phosphate isomerase/epimerase family protein [Methanoregulaceae archaeon]